MTHSRPGETAKPSVHSAAGPDVHVHVMAPASLLLVFSALVALTLLTVVVAQLSLGAWEVWTSLGIATIKAVLVAAYFMHLRYDKSFNAVILIASLLFFALFLGLTLADLQGPPP